MVNLYCISMIDEKNIPQSFQVKVLLDQLFNKYS